MKRVNTIKGEDDGIEIVIAICVKTQGRLMRHEVDRLMSNLTDKAMVSIKEAPFVSLPISHLKVS
jgi:hypothetical protein